MNWLIREESKYQSGNKLICAEQVLAHCSPPPFKLFNAIQWVQADSNNNVQCHFVGNLDKEAQKCPGHFFHFSYLIPSVSQLPSWSGCVYSLFFHKCIKHFQRSRCFLLTMSWHYWNECMKYNNYNAVVEHWSPGLEPKFHRTRGATQICAFLHVRAQTGTLIHVRAYVHPQTSS